MPYEPKPPVEYRWKPGQSGNPSGRPSRKPFTDLALEALSETDEDGKSVLRSLIEQWIIQASMGSFQHFRELLERIEGKVPEAVDVTTSQSSDPDPELAAKLLDVIRNHRVPSGEPPGDT